MNLERSFIFKRLRTAQEVVLGIFFLLSMAVFLSLNYFHICDNRGRTRKNKRKIILGNATSAVKKHKEVDFKAQA